MEKIKLWRYWNHETCYEEAKKYTCKKRFEEGSPGAYNLARKKGWLDEYTWFKRPVRIMWTKEACALEALKYSTPSEFSKKAGSAYTVSKRNGWYEEITTHFIRSHKVHPNGYWNYERCIEEALKYTKIKKFQKGSAAAYNSAHDNGWLDQVCAHMDRERKKWTYEICYNEAKKYQSRGDYMRGCPSAYHASCRNRWLKDYPWMEPKTDIFGKCDCVYKYVFKDLNSIYIGRTIRKTDRDYQHIFALGRDTVANFAHKHNIPVPPMEIIEDNLTLKEGIQKECFYIDYYKSLGFDVLNKVAGGSLGSLGKGKWTYEACLAESKKYDTRSAFSNGSPSAYSAARKHNWLNDFPWLKKKTQSKNNRIYWNQVAMLKNGTVIGTFATPSEAARKIGGKCKNIYNVLHGWSKTAYGYEWEYVS